MKKVIHILLLILWLIVIFSYSNEPGSVSTSKSDEVTYKIVGEKNNFKNYTKVIRKFAHLSEFAIVTILIYLVCSDYLNKERFIITLASSICVSVYDEIHQLFIPLRSGCFVDVAIDSLAILITLSIILMITKKEVKN